MSGESPIAWPPAHYLGGFLRPYFQAEAIASGVLQQAQGGLEEGLLCGSVMALRHPSDLPLARAGAARGDSALEASVALLLPGADAGNPCVVAPPAKINVGSAARAPLHHSSPAAPDWASEYCVWQGPAGAPELFVAPVGGAGLAWGDALKGHLLFSVVEKGAAGGGRGGGGSSARGRARAPGGDRVVGQAVLRVCDLFAAASLPFLPSCSGLYLMLHPGSEGDAAGTPPRQEFFLRIWLPLRASGGGGGGRASLLVTLSIVLPRGLVVPATALLPPPALAGGSIALSLGGGGGEGESSLQGGEGPGEEGAGGTPALGGEAPPLALPPAPTAASALAPARAVRPPRPFSSSLSSSSAAPPPGASFASDGAALRPSSAGAASRTGAPRGGGAPRTPAVARVPIHPSTVAAAEAAVVSNPRLAGYFPRGSMPRRPRPGSAASLGAGSLCGGAKGEEGGGDGSGGGNPSGGASGHSTGRGPPVDPTSVANTPRPPLAPAVPSPLPPALGASALFSGTATSRRRVVRRAPAPAPPPTAPEALSAAQVVDAGEYLAQLRHSLAAMEKELSRVKLLVSRGVGAAQKVAAYARYGEASGRKSAVGGNNNKSGVGGGGAPPERAAAIQTLAPQLMQRLEELARAHTGVLTTGAPL